MWNTRDKFLLLPFTKGKYLSFYWAEDWKDETHAFVNFNCICQIGGVDLVFRILLITQLAVLMMNGGSTISGEE